MKAALCKDFGGPEGIVIEDIAEPVAMDGEVIVDVSAAALNFFDTLAIRNKYQFKPPMPFSPGGEIAGRIGALGSGVEGFSVGDRVAAYIRWNGCREQVAVPAEGLMRIPDCVSDEVAAGLTITYGTGIHGLCDRGRLAPGDNVAVLGASGGAGLAAVEIAAAMGARVIAAASSPEKLAIAEAHGATASIDYSKEDLKSQLRTLTDGAGADIVYDCVGGPHTEPALRSTAWGGRFLVVGFAAGDIPKIPLNLVLLKGCDVVGVFWSTFADREPERNRANIEKAMGWCAEGKLKPRIHGTHPLSETIDALKVIDERRAVGKVIVCPQK